MSGSREGNAFIDLMVIMVRGSVGGVVWLLVEKWRTTFPLHVMLMLLALALVINSPMVPNALTAWLLVSLVAGLVILLVTRYGPFRENRIFGYAAAGLGSAWVLATRFSGLPTFVLADIAMGLLLVFGGLWALDKRGFEAVRLSDEMRSWHSDPDRQAETGLKDTRFLWKKNTAFGWEGELGWPGAKNSVDKVIKARGDLEAAWGEQRDTISIEPVYDHRTHRTESTKVMVRCIQKDPLKEGSVWDGRGVDDLVVPFNIGGYSDTRPLDFALWEKGIGGFHVLTAGASRSGKSQLLLLLALAYGLNPCVRSVFCDLKGGTAFKPIAPLGTWLVDNLGGALLLLELLNIECERRAHYAAAMGWDNGVWVPSPENYIICAYFDEIASLIGEGVPKEYRKRALFLISEIARKGAGIGVLLRLGTQEPTREALGSTQLITQLEWRACFRVNQKNRGQFVLPNLADQVEPARIPKTMRGSAFVDAGGEHRPMMARMHEVKTPMLRRIVQDFWHDEIEGVPREIPGFLNPQLPEGATLDEETHHDAMEAFASRKLWTPELALREDPEDPPEPEEGPGYTLPSPNAGAPRPARRPDRQVIEGSADYGSVSGAARGQIGGSEPSDAVGSGTGFEPGSVADLVAQADALRRNSPEESRLRTQALQRALNDRPEGTTRQELLLAIGGQEVRKYSWVSSRLQEFETAGTAHRVGPKTGGATWYPGPAEPEDAPEDSPIDQIEED